MSKVVTIADFLQAKREAGIKAEAEAKRKKEKREKLYNGISYLGGIILYWITSVIISMGFFAVALMSL